MSNRSPLHGLAQVLLAALRQARIDLRIQLLSPLAFGWIAIPAVMLGVLYLLRDHDVAGSTINLAQLGITGVLTTNLVMGGIMGVSGQLVTEINDGTLLRAKLIPHAMAAHLVASVLVFTAAAVVPMLIFLAAASLLFDDIAPSSPTAWWNLVWIGLLGMAATLPWGAVFGALLKTPVGLMIGSLFAYGSLAISGIFYPIAALPTWLQHLGQLLPTYWIGLGMRHALLPSQAAELELGQSWHTTTTVAVLLGWVMVGLLLAPPLLRRMARAQTGSMVAAARDRVLARGY